MLRKITSNVFQHFEIAVIILEVKRKSRLRVEVLHGFKNVIYFIKKKSAFNKKH